MTKKIKIVLIAGFAPSVINFRKTLIEALRHYADIVVAAPFYDEKTADAIEALGVQFEPFYLKARGSNPWHDIKTKYALTQLLKKHKPDKVLSYTIKPVIWGSLSAHSAGIKEIYAMITGLGYAFTNIKGFKPRLIQKITTFLYRRALLKNDRVFFQNPDDLADFKKMKIISCHQKTTIINGSGVDLNYYDFSYPVIEPIRFLMIARLLKDKGLIEYFEAAAKIKCDYPEVEFHLVGYLDDNPAAISSEILQNFLEKKIIMFHGKLDDVRPIIRESSVYVLPSYREGTPRSVLEAMSMGRAIITTDAPGCRETVVDGYNGFLIPVKNVNALALAMMKFIENKALIKAFGVSSRELVEKKYDVHRVNEVILRSIGLINL